MKRRLLFAAWMCCLTIFMVAQPKQVNHITEETVHITVPSASVKDWFNLIQRQGIILSYNPSLLDLNEYQRVNADRLTVRKLLQTILSDYRFKIIPAEGNKIILQIEGRKYRMVTGVVREAISHEKLYGASLIFSRGSQSQHYAITNSNGQFAVSLLPGNYHIEVRYMGYKSHKQTIHLEKNLALHIDLDPISFELKGVTVNKEYNIDELSEVSPSNMLSFNSIDFFSQINVLPGVTGTAASGNLQVNGGGNDENLILLDGVPIYHPNHINALMSPINGDAIKSVTFHKNFFPSEYEGRLSSITDIRFKEGNKQHFSGSTTIDMPAASATFEGPIVKNKLSFIVGTRRSWQDLFKGNSYDENKIDHTFYDINAKLSYDINDRTSLQFVGYRTSDHYLLPNEDGAIKSLLKWSNEIYALKFNTVWGSKLFNTTSITASNYSNEVYAPLIGFKERRFTKGGIKSLNMSSTFSYNIDDMYTLSCGIKYSNERFDVAATGDSINNMRKYINQFSVFYDNKIRITNRLYTQFGINVVAYLPHADRSFNSFQPRFSIKYFFSDKDMVYAGISKMEQFYHALRFDIMPLPNDFRMPSVMGFTPSISEHYELGWKHFLRHGYMESSVYYKKRDHIVALRPDYSETSFAWKRYVMNGNGSSHGVKYFLFCNWTKLMLQFSYAYSRSMEKYDILKNRGSLPSLFDIPHVCQLATTYKITKLSGLSVGFLAQSGRMTDYDYDAEGITVDQFRTKRRNSNFRIDAAYNFVKTFKRSHTRLLLRAGLYNILGNPPEEDFINMFSSYPPKHCMPFGCISFRF